MKSNSTSPASVQHDRSRTQNSGRSTSKTTTASLPKQTDKRKTAAKPSSVSPGRKSSK